MARRGSGAELARAGAPISPARAAGSCAASSEGLARRRPRGGRAAGGVTAAPAPRSARSALAHSRFQLGLRGWTAPPVPRELRSTSLPGLAQVSQHQPKDSSRSLLLAPEGWGPAAVPDLGKKEAVGSSKGKKHGIKLKSPQPSFISVCAHFNKELLRALRIVAEVRSPGYPSRGSEFGSLHAHSGSPSSVTPVSGTLTSSGLHAGKILIHIK